MSTVGTPFTIQYSMSAKKFFLTNLIFKYTGYSIVYTITCIFQLPHARPGPFGPGRPYFAFHGNYVIATLDWAPHFLFLGISAFFYKKVCKLKRSKNWSKSTKHLYDLAKIGQKRDQKSRLFSGFLMITRSRLKIAIYKGARLWNLRTRPTFSHQLILIILCVGGARGLQKTPFFSQKG